MSIDYATVFRVSGLLFMLMPAITWLLLGKPRRGAALLWCVGGILAGLSVGLISLRGYFSDFWSYNVAQPMYLACFLVLAQSLRLDIQRAWPWLWIVAVVGVYALVIALGFEDKRSQDLAVLVRLVNSVGLTALTLSAFSLARQERSRNVWFITCGYALMTISMLVTAAATMQGQISLHSLHASVYSAILGGVSLVTLLLSYMGYLGLAVERSSQQNMELRQAQLQAQQWRERSRALTLLDRQHTLDILANSLGHAILQPLTATLLHLQMARRVLQSESPDMTLVRKMLAQVVLGVNRSSSQVASIRNFLRPLPTDTGQVVLQSVIQDAHGLLCQELMYQGVAFRITMPTAHVLVQAEQLPLTQALVQVLRNAMKALQGQPDARIEVVLQTSAQEAWVEVHDSGPGFPAQVLRQDFVGAAPPLDVLVGQGLFMTQSILTQFEGHLALGNAEGGGAKVRLTLPFLAETRKS